MAAALHAFNDVLVLSKYGLPPFVVGGSRSVKFGFPHALIVVKYLEALTSPAQAVGSDQDSIEVVAVNTEENVRIKGDVLRPRLPEGRQAGSIWESLHSFWEAW